MKTIYDAEFGGERPLYASSDLKIERVTVHEGESALKESTRIEAEGCLFEGRYPFWCCNGAKIANCEFTEDSRAPIWYSTDVEMKDCRVLSPKIFREIEGLRLYGSSFPKAVETMWHCRNVRIRDCSFEGADYLLTGSSDICINDIRMKGKYAFQYCNNVKIHDSILDTKDAFWESDNVTIYDSVVSGEYLGWYSRGLTLVRCLISGTQPLCYASGLVLEDCSFAPDADLAFEYSSVEAKINGRITSVKNPLTGHIRASEGYGEVIIDENIKAPGDCVIE